MKSQNCLLVGMVFVVAFLMVGTVLADSLITLPYATGDVLLNTTVTAATSFNAAYSDAYATDGKGVGPNADYISQDGVRQAQLGVGNFNSAIGTIRIWSLGDTTAPLTVSIKSSTNANITDGKVSLAAGDYTQSLVSNHTLAWTDYYSGTDHLLYSTLDVSSLAVNNTKSLFFDFQGTQGAGFLRIVELQGYAVPEPSTVIILVTGLVSLLAYAWRKRK